VVKPPGRGDTQLRPRGAQAFHKINGKDYKTHPAPSQGAVDHGHPLPPVISSPANVFLSLRDKPGGSNLPHSKAPAK